MRLSTSKISIESLSIKSPDIKTLSIMISAICPGQGILTEVEGSVQLASSLR